MKIRVRRRGGYAGTDQNLAEADLANLSPQAAGQLRQRLNELTTASAARAESIGADLVQYQVEVDEPGSAPRIITVNDEGDPEDPAMKSVNQILLLLGS